MNFEKLQSFYDFTDCTVLVTGGAGALGLEIVHTLVECNANVIVLSRNHERATKSVAEYIKQVKSKGFVLCLSGDVLKSETLHEANETVKAEFGAVDILINAACGNHPSAHAHPCLFGGEGSGKQLHAMAGSPYGAEVFAAYPR